MMTIAEVIAWEEEQERLGRKDPFGYSFLSYKVAVFNLDGTPVRNERGHQIFETHAEAKARIAALVVPPLMHLDLAPIQMGLF
jgi:hypothetical protein